MIAPPYRCYMGCVYDSTSVTWDVYMTALPYRCYMGCVYDSTALQVCQTSMNKKSNNVQMTHSQIQNQTKLEI